MKTIIYVIHSGDLPFVKEEKEDRMKLRTIEMPKVDLNKPLEDMNEQEKMIYYFLNCHKGMEDSKIKMMIESDEVIQMLEKRVETISDDRWKKIIEDFQKLHENEEQIELQLELEEAQKQIKEAQKAREEARKEKDAARKEKEVARKEKDAARKEKDAARKEKEKANRQVEEANRHVENANKLVEQKNQEMKQIIQGMLSNGMSLEFVSKLLSKSESEIMELVK